MAHIQISADLPLDLIAEAAGQSDPSQRSYCAGVLTVNGVTQQALTAAAAKPPAPIPPTPSDIDVRLAALESKVGITPQDQAVAKTELIATATAELTSEPAQLSIKAG